MSDRAQTAHLKSAAGFGQHAILAVRRAAMRARELVSGLSGWRRAAVALAAGGAASFALAPYHLIPLLAVSFTCFVWLMDGLPKGRAGLVRAGRDGFLFGLGYFLAGLYWVGFAFLVDAQAHAWMMPLGVVILPAGMALYWGLGAVLSKLLWRAGWQRIVVLALCFTAAEWLRGHLLTGFPWNLAAYAWLDVLPVAQLAAFLGAYGLTFLTILLMASPAVLGDPPASRERAPWQAAVFPALCLAGLALAWGFGLWRLAADGRDTVPGAMVRIVQPSVPQAEKWNPERREEFWNRLLALSGRESKTEITHTVWPEAAVPHVFRGSQPQLPDLRAAIGDSLLLTGALRVEPGDGSRGYRGYNAFFVFDDSGRPLSVYDKHHLVPFGEYVPFRNILTLIGLEKIGQGLGETTPGPGLRTIKPPRGPAFGPLICYEAIFPGKVVARGQRPEWLVNVTDDAWYGDTPGPRQHFALSRMRAIEEGLPVARAANNGISGMVDAYGRVWQELALDAIGVIDTELPRALPRTLYARLGDAVPATLLLAVFLWLAGPQLVSTLRARIRRSGAS
ncbi:MAG: apolipoprotein N-acyltransferase [Alphaproteobacteria bacterium]